MRKFSERVYFVSFFHKQISEQVTSEKSTVAHDIIIWIFSIVPIEITIKIK